MWEFIKHKLAKIGCFAVIGLIAIGAAALAKLVYGWLRYDEATQNALSAQVGEYVGKGILGIGVLIGFILMGRQVMAELRAKKSSPPPLPAQPPPLPTELVRGRKGQSNENDRNPDHAP